MVFVVGAVVCGNSNGKAKAKSNESEGRSRGVVDPSWCIRTTNQLCRQNEGASDCNAEMCVPQGQDLMSGLGT